MTKTAAKAPSFEESLAELESIVARMEDGDVPLAELLDQFETGTKLLKVCEDRLKQAELRIEKLKQAKDGSDQFEDFASPEDNA